MFKIRKQSKIRISLLHGCCVFSGKVIPFDSLNEVEMDRHTKSWKGFIYQDGVKHCVGDAVFIIPKENSRY